MQDYVLSVAVSHDGAWVVSGSKDRGVQFWDAHTAIVQCMLQGHKNSVISIDLSPAGNVLATGSGDWQARICEFSFFYFSFYTLFFFLLFFVFCLWVGDLCADALCSGSYNTAAA